MVVLYSSWSHEDSHYSGGPRNGGSWEGDSFCDSHTHSYDSCDSDYGSVSIEHNVREYMDYKLFASNEDSDSREDPGEEEPSSESTEEETITHTPCLGCLLST